MAQTMIEQVARAIYEVRTRDAAVMDTFGDQWSMSHPNLRHEYMLEARAAISAMRITEESNPEDNGGLLGGFATFGSPAQIWNARIDEALGEGGN